MRANSIERGFAPSSATATVCQTSGGQPETLMGSCHGRSVSGPCSRSPQLWINQAARCQQCPARCGASALAAGNPLLAFRLRDGKASQANVLSRFTGEPKIKIGLARARRFRQELP
jgi:hypothetical protein